MQYAQVRHSCLLIPIPIASKMLSHVAIRYDKGSTEYEMAGRKTRDRRKAPRKTIADRKTTMTKKAVAV